ncbi:MIP aquaporin family [Rhizoctonia solani]|uniref:MIP aquaporin family n=1 Tax=Rhizoctonia solani TaxID=456999 RepID=A0A8H7M2W0_9AGAM|nr:MIP aquaporin family [Rhizoctonia solani]
MILIIFGTGVNCQVTLSNYTISSRPPSSKGEYLSISFGWAIGAALGVWVSGGISADDLSNFQCFFSEALGTAVLLIVLAAITDKHNGPPPSGLVPLAVFITILGEGACLGNAKLVWTYRDQYWLHTPIAGPIVGAIVGTAIYDAFIFTGPESIFNRQDAATRRRRLGASTKPKVGISSDDQIV